MTEIRHGYPDFKMTLVGEEQSNVSLTYDGKYIRIDGIAEGAARERIAKYVVQYLENPNKKAEDEAKRAAYKKLPPKEKLADLIKRIKGRYPNFDYKWVGLGEGNVEVEYGDNSLIISGIDDDGTREETAHGIMRIQKEIDKMSKGDVETEK